MSVLIPRRRNSLPSSQREEFSDVEVAWLAGLLEGEASFMLLHNIVGGKRYRYPSIVIGMTDPDVIARVAGFFGTKVHQFENGRRINGTPGKPIYRAVVTGERGAAFMRAVLPYMGERRSAKIREILSYQAGRKNPDELRRAWSSAKAATRGRDAKGRLVSR